MIGRLNPPPAPTLAKVWRGVVGAGVNQSGGQGNAACPASAWHSSMVGGRFNLAPRSTTIFAISTSSEAITRSSPYHVRRTKCPNLFERLARNLPRE